MIKEIVENIKSNRAMDSYCPHCDEAFDPDDKTVEYVVRLHMNTYDEWVLIAYHRDCYDNWVGMWGPKVAA